MILILFFQKFPVIWQGQLALKNDSSLVQMHFVSGNRRLPPNSLPPAGPDPTNPAALRINQRMRLEPAQLEGVARRIMVGICLTNRGEEGREDGS